MRQLYVIASVDPRAGGPVEGVRLSAQVLREMGCAAEVVTLDDPRADFLSEFPIPVHAVGPGVGRYGYTSALARWIVANGHRFDTATIHGLWNHASIGGWQGLRKAGVPYALFSHGMLDPYFRSAYPMKHAAKQVFWWLWQGKVLRDAKAVLFTCEEERLLARQSFRPYAAREQVVAYGTAPPPPADPDQEKAFRALLPALGARPYLLFLSRIHEKKGCDLLVRGFAAIAGEHLALDLVIAGPDQVGWKADLIALAQEYGIAHRIHWPGMVSGVAKYGAYRGAEAFVLPSHQENFGIVVAEALACGCPVLISDKVNIWREIEEAAAGIVAPDTLAGTENLLRRFLSLTGAEKKAMSRAGRDLYQRRFTNHAAGMDLLRVLRDFVAGGVDNKPAASAARQASEIERNG